MNELQFCEKTKFKEHKHSRAIDLKKNFWFKKIILRKRYLIIELKLKNQH